LGLKDKKYNSTIIKFYPGQCNTRIIMATKERKRLKRNDQVQEEPSKAVRFNDTQPLPSKPNQDFYGSIAETYFDKFKANDHKKESLNLYGNMQ